MDAKVGTFEWWASIVAAQPRRRVVCGPAERALLRKVLRPSAVRALLAGKNWGAREVYPTQHNFRPGKLPGYLYSRSFRLTPSDVVKYFVRPLIVRILRDPRDVHGRIRIIVPKGTRTHTGCAAHMRRIEKVWALYRRYPTSVIAQQMLVACANALRARGRPIPPMGKRPVPLKDVAKLANMELRRVVVEVQGVRLPRKPLAQDAVGKLYRIDAQQNLLEVRCPSTGRRYLLGVPTESESVYNAKRSRWETEHLNTPTKAQRWTLGIEVGTEVEVVAQT